MGMTSLVLKVIGLVEAIISWMTNDMKSFKQHIVEFDNPQIYCDMDGVVGDFLKFTRNILGTKFRDRFWEDIPEDTFAQLDKMPDADVLWGYIKQFDPIMLTLQESQEDQFPRDHQKIK